MANRRRRHRRDEFQPVITAKATLDDFETVNSAGEPRSLTLEERLLTPISPSIGLRVSAGRGDPLHLQNRGTESYLFRDNYDRWFILQLSAKNSEEAFIRWLLSLLVSRDLLDLVTEQADEEIVFPPER